MIEAEMVWCFLPVCKQGLLNRWFNQKLLNKPQTSDFEANNVSILTLARLFTCNKHSHHVLNKNNFKFFKTSNQIILIIK